MNKVVCIGESLIDFMQVNNELVFQANAGGAPGNVCACIAKLGAKACFLGKLSNDVFSQFLLKTLQKWGVNTDYTVIDSSTQTALAFVSHDENGDRQFNFYRNNTCDMMLNENEIQCDMLTQGDILHFCSVGLVESPTKYAHLKAIQQAVENNCLISFDVNIRANLWDNIDNCVGTIKEFMPYADILKVTDDELQLICGDASEQENVQKIFAIAKKCQILIVTKGPKGVAVYDRDLKSLNRDAVDVPVVDTTGAGDCFIGCVLYRLITDKALLKIENFADIIDFASYGCGIVISKKGAMEAMPTLKDIENAKLTLK